MTEDTIDLTTETETAVENGDESTNQTVIETDGGGSALESLEQIIIQVLENEVLILGLGALGLVFYYLYNEFKDENPFEDREPDEVTRKWLKQELKHGKKTDKTLVEKNDRNIIERGKIIYEYADRVPSETISPVINPEGNTNEEFEATEDVWLFKVRPNNESKLKWLFFDVILDKDKISTYYIIKKDNVQVHNDEVTITDDVNLDYNRGVFMDRTTEAKNKANQIIRMESQNELVKGHVNYAPKVNFMDPGHSMVLDKIEERKEEDNDI